MDRREFLSGAALLTAAVAGCSRSTAEQSTPGATDIMPYDAVNGEGAQALHIETVLNWIRGDAVVSGCDPSDGTNAMEVDIASGTVRVDGSNVSVSAQTVTLLAGGTDPRKDLIWIDSTGTAQASPGIEAPYRPPDKTGFNTHQPSPPDSTGVNGAVVAEVVVDAGASDINGTPGQDLRDRRVLSSLDLDSLLAGSVDADELNNKVTVEPGENIQQALNDAQPSNSWGYSHVSLKPGYGSEGVVYDLPDADLPITVPSKTVFDIRGAYIDGLDGTGDLFNLSARTYVLGEGAAIRPPAGGVFVVDTSIVGPIDTNDPLYVTGHPHVIGSNGGGFAIDYRQNTADSLTGCYISAYLHNGKSPARFRSTDATGYCSGNIADVHGKAVADATDAQSLFVFEGGGDIHHNAGVVSEVLQVSGGNYVAEFSTGYENVVTDQKSGYVADPGNAVGGIVLTDTNAGPRNRVEFDYNWSWSNWTDNSGSLQYVGRGGGMWLAQNLSGKSGYSDGFSVTDNGTNTTSGLPELCVWDTSNSQWHSMGGDTFV